ncbi:MAG: toxin-antitoxin system HicB family antitoxin [Cyanobacteria bacterium P01_D01_bin.1]
MHRLTLKIPADIHKQIKSLAKQEGVSINQYITYLIADQIASQAVQSEISLPADNARSKSDDDDGVMAAPESADVTELLDTAMLSEAAGAPDTAVCESAQAEKQPSIDC